MAYYSNQGAQIHSGAAGLGQNRGGPLTAFQDGSLGFMSRFRPAAIRSLYSRRRRPKNAVYYRGSVPTRGFGAGMGAANWGPSPMAYQDGSLGGGYGPREAFKDGSLGMPLFLETQQGIQQLEDPVTLFHGSMGEYFSGMAGCRGCGLGQEAQPPTLDLSNTASVLEVKQAMVIAPWMGSALQLPEATADVENPVWTEMTVQIVGAWISGYVEFLYSQPTPPNTPKAEFMDALIAEAFEGEFFVPNALGIRNIYFGATLGATGVGINPAEAFPILTKFLSDEEASGASGGVLPPAIEGQASAGGGNMLAIGLGVAAMAIVGVAVMGGGKRRKR